MTILLKIEILQENRIVPDGILDESPSEMQMRKVIGNFRQIPERISPLEIPDKILRKLSIR